MALDVTNSEQAGDLAKAVAAIIAAVESSDPPAFLLLGPDALMAYRYIADRRAIEQPGNELGTLLTRPAFEVLEQPWRLDVLVVLLC